VRERKRRKFGVTTAPFEMEAGEAREGVGGPGCGAVWKSNEA
jgi:hypothetical protein